MTSVLYDAPGPKARRNSLIGSIVGGLAILGLIFVVYRRLEENGQFEPDLWTPLLNPTNEFFAQVWALLGAGFRQTLTAAAISIVLSLVAGVALGTLRMSLATSTTQVARVLRWPVIVYTEFARATPVVLAIFFVAQVFPQFNFRLPNLWYLVIALTYYNSAIFAEILRAGVASLPKGQREAGLAIGLTPLRTLQLIQMPQAFRVMLPALISQMVVCLKDTTLAAVALSGFIEALNQGKIVYQNLGNPIQTYVVIGAVFITINYALGRLATYLERRMSRRTAGDPKAVNQATTASNLPHNSNSAT